MFRKTFAPLLLLAAAIVAVLYGVDRLTRLPERLQAMPQDEGSPPQPASDQTDLVRAPMEAVPPAPEPLTNAIGMSLRLIPAGTFRMGGDQSPEEIERVVKTSGSLTRAEFFADEQPQHSVRITRPFYLGTHEVTQGQWRAVMESNPSYFTATGGGKESVGERNTSDFPVETVSWYDALEFCNQLSMREGRTPYYTLTGVERSEGSIGKASVSIVGGDGYRLPTEAEWEYACRAGTMTPFHFGSACDGTRANVDGNFPYGTTNQGPCLQRTTSVGQYEANAFGLHDMHGNVSEWCFDDIDENAYQSRAETTDDPVVNSSSVNRRVVRGGGGNFDAWSARSAVRSSSAPIGRSSWRGFRVARSP